MNLRGQGPVSKSTWPRYEYLLESGYPRHAIVYIPTPDFGQDLWETDQGGWLKTICPDKFFDIVIGGCIFKP